MMLVILVLAQSLVLVTPEIIDLGLNMIIDASSDEVHFVRGFLKAPASIDLSGVRWITNEELVFDFDEGEYGDDFNEDGYDKIWDPDEDDDLVDDDDNLDDDDDIDDVAVDDDVDTVAPESETSVPTSPEIDPEDVSGVTNVEDSETGEDAPEVEKEVPSDIPEEETEEGADSEGTDETPESDVGGDDQDESTPTEDEDAVEEEKEIDGDAEETPTEDQDEASGTEEDAVDNAGEDEDQPESESTTVEEVEEPVEEEAEDVVEEPTTESPPEEENAEGNDETESTEDETEEEKEPSPVVDEANEEAEVEEETSSEPPTEDEEVEDETDEEEPTDNGGNRTLGFTEFVGAQDQIMDIIVFAVPADCKKDSSGSCDWVALGVGAYDDEMVGEMSYCCSKDTADRNICDSSDIGTMMIDHTIFDGDHRKIEVPAEPLKDFEMDDPVFDIKKTGDYVMVLANCNDDGFGVITLGSMEWKSVGGFLPGEMFDFMFFLGATSAIYLVMMVWYYYGMKSYQDAAIPIQKYILATIFIGFLAHSFKSIDFLYWNIKGTRSNAVMYIGKS